MEVQLIQQTQRIYFRNEWRALSCGRPLPIGSKLLSLKPKLDDDGVMKSDGRLQQA